MYVFPISRSIEIGVGVERPEPELVKKLSHQDLLLLERLTDLTVLSIQSEVVRTIGFKDMIHKLKQFFIFPSFTGSLKGVAT